MLQATLTGGCGYFVVPDNVSRRPSIGLSVGGRFELANSFGDGDGNADDLTISILNDAHCTPNQTIRLSVDAFYPGSATPALPTEYVDVVLNPYIPPAKTPRIAWVGDMVSIPYCGQQQRARAPAPPCTLCGRRTSAARSSRRPV